MSIKISPVLFFLTCFEVLGIIILSMINGSPLSFMVVLIIWSVSFSYTILNIKDNCAIVCFLIAVFVFLLGRELYFEFFDLQRYYLYLIQYDTFAYRLISISIIFVMLGALYEKQESKCKKKEDIKVSKIIQQICLYLFILSLGASIIYTFIQIYKIKSSGYVASYIANGNVASLLDYIAAFTPIAVCLYLATNPSKKWSIYVLLGYGMWATMTLFTGHRFTFVAVGLFIITYFVIRERKEGNWIKKRYIIFLLICAPVLLIVLAWLDNYRVGNYSYNISVFGSIRDFFDQQGGSINVIKRIKYYENEIEDMTFVSFDSLRTNLFENLIMRKLFGVDSYSGNSVEHALYGHSLAHRLSWYEYKLEYLNGHGVGSCYIAELYKDGGIIAVCAGSFLYGFLLKRISTLDLKGDFIKDGILLSFFTGLILAPRDSFDGFLKSITSVYSLLGIICIIIIKNYTNNKYKGV